MSEFTAIIPEKVHDCQGEGHKLIQIQRGTTWYYACEHCHYVLEAHCIDQNSMVLSTP
ncbi:hypothetical protein ACFL3D_02740 [Candidatus Omnitrophota bacterium]